MKRILSLSLLALCGGLVAAGVGTASVTSHELKADEVEITSTEAKYSEEAKAIIDDLESSVDLGLYRESERDYIRELVETAKTQIANALPLPEEEPTFVDVSWDAIKAGGENGVYTVTDGDETIILRLGNAPEVCECEVFGQTGNFTPKMVTSKVFKVSVLLTNGEYKAYFSFDGTKIYKVDVPMPDVVDLDLEAIKSLGDKEFTTPDNQTIRLRLATINSDIGMIDLDFNGAFCPSFVFDEVETGIFRVAGSTTFGWIEYFFGWTGEELVILEEGPKEPEPPVAKYINLEILKNGGNDGAYTVEGFDGNFVIDLSSAPIHCSFHLDDFSTDANSEIIDNEILRVYFLRTVDSDYESYYFSYDGTNLFQVTPPLPAYTANWPVDDIQAMMDDLGAEGSMIPEINWMYSSVMGHDSAGYVWISMYIAGYAYDSYCEILEEAGYFVYKYDEWDGTPIYGKHGETLLIQPAQYGSEFDIYFYKADEPLVDPNYSKWPTDLINVLIDLTGGTGDVCPEFNFEYEVLPDEIRSDAGAWVLWFDVTNAWSRIDPYYELLVDAGYKYVFDDEFGYPYYAKPGETIAYNLFSNPDDDGLAIYCMYYDGQHAEGLVTAQVASGLAKEEIAKIATIEDFTDAMDTMNALVDYESFVGEDLAAAEAKRDSYIATIKALSGQTATKVALTAAVDQCEFEISEILKTENYTKADFFMEVFEENMPSVVITTNNVKQLDEAYAYVRAVYNSLTDGEKILVDERYETLIGVEEHTEAKEIESKFKEIENVLVARKIDLFAQEVLYLVSEDSLVYFEGYLYSLYTSPSISEAIADNFGPMYILYSLESKIGELSYNYELANDVLDIISKIPTDLSKITDAKNGADIDYAYDVVNSLMYSNFLFDLIGEDNIEFVFAAKDRLELVRYIDASIARIKVFYLDYFTYEDDEVSAEYRAIINDFIATVRTAPNKSYVDYYEFLAELLIDSLVTDQERVAAAWEAQASALPTVDDIVSMGLGYLDDEFVSIFRDYEEAYYSLFDMYQFNYYAYYFVDEDLENEVLSTFVDLANNIVDFIYTYAELCATYEYTDTYAANLAVLKELVTLYGDYVDPELGLNALITLADEKDYYIAEEIEYYCDYFLLFATEEEAAEIEQIRSNAIAAVVAAPTLSAFYETTYDFVEELNGLLDTFYIFDLEDRIFTFYHDYAGHLTAAQTEELRGLYLEYYYTSDYQWMELMYSGAEDLLFELLDEFDVRLAADEVKEAINAIGRVDLTKEALINEARELLEECSNETKALLESEGYVERLETAEEVLNSMKTELVSAKTSAKKAINDAIAALDMEQYSEENQAVLATTQSTGLSAIDSATSVNAVNAAMTKALNDIASVKTIRPEIAPVEDKIIGCEGSIVAASGLISLVTLLGAGLICSKRKED